MLSVFSERLIKKIMVVAIDYDIFLHLLQYYYLASKGGKFLKKLWRCVGGSITLGVLRWEYYVSSASPSSERIEELWVVCGLYTEIWSYAIGWCLAT